MMILVGDVGRLLDLVFLLRITAPVPRLTVTFDRILSNCTGPSFVWLLHCFLNAYDGNDI